MFGIGPPGAAAAPNHGPLIRPLENISPPATRGPMEVGWTLTALDGYWSGDQPITFAHSWMRCLPGGFLCEKIPDATSDNYTLGPADEGAEIRLRVVASNPSGTRAATSLGAAAVMPTSSPVLEGTSVDAVTQASSLTLGTAVRQPPRRRAHSVTRGRRAGLGRPRASAELDARATRLRRRRR